MSKRQIIPFFILMVVFYNTIGFVATFNAVRKEWKCRMRRELVSIVGSNSSLKVFHFHQSEFQDHTKEFEHDGRWFDVVKTEIAGDLLTVYAFDDENETNMVAEFQSLIIKQTSQDSDFSHNTKQLFNHLIKELLFDNVIEIDTPSVKIAFSHLFSHKEFPINSPFLFIESPPPKA